MENKDLNIGIDKTIVMSGDSLTSGSGGTAITTLLQGYIGNRFVFNEAIPGQTTAQIAARMGAKNVYVTISGNTTSTTNKIAVTNISTQLLSTTADTTTRIITGVLMVGQGIQCVLERTVVSTVETYTLQPVLSQTTAVPANSLFIPDNQLNYQTAINILWWGRNDTPSFTDTKTLIDTYVNNLKSPKRVFIIGVLVGSSETIGTSNNTAILAVNNSLLTAYPNNYIEATPPTLEEMAYIGYTPIAQDLIDIANGVFPATMKADNIHLNTIGYSIFALRIYRKLKNII